MSLLSRTLQTILSKYILDVDVEGIALPSLLGSSSNNNNNGSALNGGSGASNNSNNHHNHNGSTNTGSKTNSNSNSNTNSSSSSNSNDGWGVRLSNVKLREGVQLMVLPGTLPPRERTSRRKRKSSTIQMTPKTLSTTSKTTPTATTTAEMPHDVPPNTQPSNYQPEYHSEKQYDDDDDDNDDAGDDDMDDTNQEPATARQSWFSGWFRTTTQPSSPPPQQQQQYEDGYETNEPPRGHPSTVRQPHNNKNGNHSSRDHHYTERIDDETSAFYPQQDIILDDDNQTTCSFAGEDPDENDINNNNNDKPNDDYDDDWDDNDNNTDNNDPMVDERPLVLKLGRDGTIGILDVRLVGKTIHVLIEDADLTLEVVRQQSANVGGTETTTTTSTSSSSQQQQAAAAAAAQKKKTNVPLLNTTGDRVLAENILARYLSILPNLFLRDVRIRLIIRNDDDDDDDNDETQHPHDSHQNGDDTNRRSKDTVIEVVIGLFSVNDGKDFLLNFAGEVGNDVDDDYKNTTASDVDVDDDLAGHMEPTKVDGMTSTAPSSGATQTIATYGTANTGNTNEFLTKRVRTGRGPEGGIVVRIYPGPYDDRDRTTLATSSGSTNVRWAHETWQNSTEYVFVRCSGLDVQAQIFLGTKKEIAIHNYGYYSEDVPYNDFTVDAMLFGVDYIVPGPQPPLPKISNVPQVLPNPSDAETWATTGSTTTFVADTNGIQSCRIPSPFHKVARGFIPHHCMGTHLPSEPCHRCWIKEGGASSPHILDASTPLAGLIAHVSVRDPLEINVDRYNLSVLGRLIKIFSKQNNTIATGTSNDDFDGDQNSTSEIPVGSGHSIKSHTSMPNMLPMSYQSIDDSGRSTISGRRISKTQSLKKLDEVTIKTAFPVYMKPEKVQIIGFHIADVRFRVHALRRNRDLEYGRSYSYWDVAAKCTTLDFQNLSATERPFQDIRLDIAHLTVHQLKGVDQKQIISLGVRPRNVEFDDVTIDTFVNTATNRIRTTWPTTSAAIMDIVPPLESMRYADREYHGLQLRYLAVLDPSESVNRSRKDVNIRVGPAVIDVEFRIKDEIAVVIGESVASVIGPPKPFPTPSTAKPTDSILKYKVISDGGRVDLKPLISADLPRTVSQGEISKRAGFSVEAFLDEFRIAYGRPSPVRMLDHGLSLQQLANLPDNVRLRVLLFLKDLKPLESALGLPNTPNIFLRCRAVNNGIVQMADSHHSTNLSSDDFGESRRQSLIGELLSLDDDTLDNMLLAHRRMKERNLPSDQSKQQVLYR